MTAPTPEPLSTDKAIVAASQSQPEFARADLSVYVDDIGPSLASTRQQESQDKVSIANSMARVADAECLGKEHQYATPAKEASRTHRTYAIVLGAVTAIVSIGWFAMVYLLRDQLWVLVGFTIVTLSMLLVIMTKAKAILESLGITSK